MAGGISGRQWIRQCTVTVAGQPIVLDNMQVQFMVRQTDIQHPNWCYVRMTNLSDETSKAIFQKGASVQINAGYKGRSGIIFDGNATQMRKGKEPNGTDKYFDIVATSGRIAYGFATVQKTLPAGSTMKDIADEAIKSMEQYGVRRGPIAEMGDKKHPRAVTLFGMSRDILRYVAEATNSSWNIHNGELQIVKNDEYVPGGPIEINADTGMIGLPEQQLEGIVVKILLNPDCRPGQRVHIDADSIQQMITSQGWPGTESITIGPWENRGPLPQGQQTGGSAPKIAEDGMYRIVRVDHDGNMEGQEWYTTLTCIATDESGPAASGIGKGDAAMRAIPEDDKKAGGSGGGTGGN